KVGDYVELPISVPDQRRYVVTVYATRSWDYGIVDFKVNGMATGGDVDLFNAKGHDVAATGPLVLGTFDPKDGKITVRATLVGSNQKSEGSKSFFGLDCIVLEAK